jgi:hypothetical protein
VFVEGRDPKGHTHYVSMLLGITLNSTIVSPLGDPDSLRRATRARLPYGAGHLWALQSKRRSKYTVRTSAAAFFRLSIARLGVSLAIRATKTAQEGAGVLEVGLPT